MPSLPPAALAVFAIAGLVSLLLVIRKVSTKRRPREVVICPIHGKSYAAFVCQHLVRGQGAGFFHADPVGDDPCPDAWCGECDRRLVANGGQWDDETEAFAQVTVICAGCYQTARQRNEN